MPVHFIHAPYVQVSREKLIALQKLNADIIYTERWNSSDDSRYDFTQEQKDENYISFLPTILLVDDDNKTVLARAEKIEHITKQNIDWLHEQHKNWKQNGRKNKFSIPPWKG